MKRDDERTHSERNQHTIDLPRLLTAEPLAKAINVSVSRIYQLARDGVIPCVRIGRQVRFLPAQVARFLAQGGSR